MKINIARKLASRKFWAFFATFITSLLVAFNFTENQIVQVTAVVTNFGAMAVYVLSEASVDKVSVNKDE